MRSFVKFLIYLIPPLLVCTIIYWPLYRPIKLGDSETRDETDTKKLDFPLDEELLGILGLPLPINRHKLCLINNNQVYLIHTDNYPLFRTPDISQTPEAKESKAGAMAVELHYSDNSKDEIYREIGEPIKCENLNTKKILQSFASSTVFYRHISLENKTEIDLGEFGHLVLIRPIANSFVYTGSQWSLFSSRAAIVANWKYFIATLAVLLYAWYKLFNKLKKKIPSKILEWLRIQKFESQKHRQKNLVSSKPTNLCRH